MKYSSKSNPIIFDQISSSKGYLFKSDLKDTEKIVFIGSTHFWSWNDPFFTFFVWYRWIYFGCFLSLLFQENSLKIFFFKKSMFVAFLYIALILGFSQSIVSRAWGDRFRPLVHPLESEVGPHRGPLHQPQDHSRVEKKSTHQHQPTAKILFYPIFDIRTYSIISLYYKSLL